MKFIHLSLLIAAIPPVSVATSDNNTEHQKEPNSNSLRAHAVQENSLTGVREGPISPSSQDFFTASGNDEDSDVAADEISTTLQEDIYPGHLCISDSALSGTTRDDRCTSRWCKYGRCTCFDDKHCNGSPDGPYCDCDRRSCVKDAKRGRLPGEDYECCPLECEYGGKDGKCDLPAGSCSSLAGGGWGMVRHCPPGKKWHSATDSLAGTDQYGTPSAPEAGWSIKFDSVDHDQFLFATGDCEKWLVASVDAVIGANYENSPREVMVSSEIGTPYTPAWYNRAGHAEDPWISIVDHDKAINSDFILYGESGFTNQALSHVHALLNHDGADVYIRKAIPDKFNPSRIPKVFYIENPDSGLVFDIWYASCDDEDVHLWPLHKKTNQQFRLGSDGEIIDVGCNKVLQIGDENCDDLQDVSIGDLNGGDHQKWDVKADSTIESRKCPGKVLETEAPQSTLSSQHGPNIFLNERNGSSNQKWMFVSIDVSFDATNSGSEKALD